MGLVRFEICTSDYKDLVLDSFDGKVGKNPSANAGDRVSILGLGRVLMPQST